MCFYATIKDTKEVERVMRSGKVRFWKWVIKRTRRSEYFNGLYPKGKIVKANRQRKRIKRTSCMTNGIYVYRSRPKFENNKSYFKLIRVEAKVSDLIGADFEYACFTKVKVLT